MATETGTRTDTTNGTTNGTATDTRYLFETGSDHGRVQVDCLSAMLDSTTTGVLDDLGVREGWRCLELGAGNGSVARWMAQRVGPAGSVAAVDIDTRHLDPAPGVTAYRHDINDGLPQDGPFDVIHARMLLVHLPRREQILRTLAGALAPGGWLVVTDISDRLPTAAAGTDPGPAELFDRVLDAGMNGLGRAAGMDLEWARDVGRHLRDAGLEDIHGLEDAFTARGGTPALLYYRSLIKQLEQPLQAAGLTADEVRRFGDLMLDPQFSAWSYQFVTTWGRRPR
ncbi:class I SAM-dependent methyltransferase [Isoptericola cucumis]|uniref:Methyltransferase n=1 Tax=Isoptericola cucumis TaxID=1776856 RepID=A0ABQ2B5T5_9MICO|nr:class I SAM-dependent methyltransferase [Isoptericola cucumis]GGI06076.1 methyltransferase [Isoptericola cucumis]